MSRSPAFYRKCLVLGLLSFSILLFQNMSLIDGSFDIRDYAPKKPEGYGAFDWNPNYVQDLDGSSLNALGGSLLKYQLDPYAKDLEHRINRHFRVLNVENGEAQLVTATTEAEKVGQFKFGILSTQKMRFTYENDIRLLCESTLTAGHLRFGVQRAISSTTDLQIWHESDTKSSSVNMNFEW